MLGRGVAAVGAIGAVRRHPGRRAARPISRSRTSSRRSPRPHDPRPGRTRSRPAPGSAALLADAGFDAMGDREQPRRRRRALDRDRHVEALRAAGLLAVGGGTTRPRRSRRGSSRSEACGSRSSRSTRPASGRARRPRRPASRGGTRTSCARPWRALARAPTSSRSASTAAPSTSRRPTPSCSSSRACSPRGAPTSSGGRARTSSSRSARSTPTATAGRRSSRRASATSLFDQHIPGTAAARCSRSSPGRTASARSASAWPSTATGRVTFRGWRARPRATRSRSRATGGRSRDRSSRSRCAGPRRLAGFEGDVVDAALGDVDGDGRRELVVAFRRPYRRDRGERAARAPMRSSTRSAARRTSACTGRATCGRGGWRARSCGPSPRSPRATARSPSPTRPWTDPPSSPPARGDGAGSASSRCPSSRARASPACADVDGDGALDPLVLERSSR